MSNHERMIEIPRAVSWVRHMSRSLCVGAESTGKYVLAAPGHETDLPAKRMDVLYSQTNIAWYTRASWSHSAGDRDTYIHAFPTHTR